MLSALDALLWFRARVQVLPARRRTIIRGGGEIMLPPADRLPPRNALRARPPVRQPVRFAPAPRLIGEVWRRANKIKQSARRAAELILISKNWPKVGPVRPCAHRLLTRQIQSPRHQRPPAARRCTNWSRRSPGCRAASVARAASGGRGRPPMDPPRPIRRRQINSTLGWPRATPISAPPSAPIASLGARRPSRTAKSGAASWTSAMFAHVT